MDHGGSVVEKESTVVMVEPVATTRTGWRRLFLPVTYGYAALLISVTVLLSILSEATQTRVVLHASTNLYNLLHGRIGTLFSSAFVIDDLQSAAVIIPLLACLLALAEMKFGALRLLRIFVVGHVGATVIVALGLWIAVSANWLPVEVTHVSDVGVSYGAMALIGAFIALVPSRWKPTWAITWLAVAVAGVAMGRTFTNVGHLLAFSIGLLAGYRVLRRGRTELPKLNAWEGGLLTAASILGYIMLVG
ncbi:rhomboid family intramembrane serine protease [Nocardia sp. NPDC056100]|uniref:rhomboid family intramembrane serine protease n=1 Tax=Nocardia sp. NPDC056100 TaxID=3345712 RepID=UPI0035D6A42D